MSETAPFKSFIRDHGYKPQPVFFNGPDAPSGAFSWSDNQPVQGVPYFGVELEVTFPKECWDISGYCESRRPAIGLDGESSRPKRLQPFGLMVERVQDIAEKPEWYWKTDASLANRGLEIVTHPMSLGYHKTFWPNALAELRNRGINNVPELKKLGSCHIHISRSFFTPCEERRLYLFTQANALRIEILARRKANHWCVIGRRGPMKYKNCNNRMEAVNFNNRTTIEFRSFDTTTDEATLIGTLEYVRALAGFVKTVNGVQLIKDRSWPLFLDYCKSSGYKSFLSYWEGIQNTPPSDREASSTSACKK